MNQIMRTVLLYKNDFTAVSWLPATEFLIDWFQ